MYVHVFTFPFWGYVCVIVITINRELKPEFEPGPQILVKQVATLSINLVADATLHPSQHWKGKWDEIYY